MAETGLKKLFEAYKRRRVFRVTALYVIAFWPLIQLVDILSSPLEIPDYFMRYLVFGFFGGLPFVLMFAWLYDFRSGDIKVGKGEPQLALLGSKTEFTFIAALVVVVSALFFVQLSIDDAEETASNVVRESDITPVAILGESLVRTFDSIAVLPFVSFSLETRDQFFADGLTEELLNVLSRVPKLKVAARTSSFAYKGVRKNVQIIGNELGVSTILEGSVRKNDVDDTIRITAQLIDVSNGAHLWSKTFDREFKDVFKIQDEISRAVVDQLKVTLGAKIELQPRNKSANPEALIAFSMGQAALSKRTEEGLRDAGKYFQEALSADPNYALAYTGLADANTLLVNYGFVDAADGLPKAEDAVSAALELDPNLGIAWASRGLILSQQKEKSAAESALLKAIELNPNYAMAYMWYASIQPVDSDRLSYYQQAFSLDPKSAVAGFNVASLLVREGRDAEAMDVFSQIVEADPFYAKAYILVARMSNNRGQIAEAIRQYRRSYDLNNDALIAVQIAGLYSDIGDFKAADRWFALAEDELPEKYRSRFTLIKAQRYAAEGDSSAASTHLQALFEREIKDQSDYYLRSLAAYYDQDFEGAVALYEESIASPIEGMDDDVKSEVLAVAKIVVAYAYKKHGRLDESIALRTEAEQAINQIKEGDEGYSAENWYHKAQIAALKNDDENVRQLMQKAIDEGWRDFWLPGLDPLMQDYRGDTLIQSMLAGLETRMSIIREQFEVEAQFASRWDD
ncbi:MAG: TolB-like protein/Tfp pilus assembly protein PilF [Flavobacterium sp.]